MKEISKEELIEEITQINTTNLNNINIDNDDIEILSKNKELILMSAFKYIGVDASDKAMQLILSDLDSEGVQISKADSLLFIFEIHPDYELINISDSMNIIHEVADSQADVIFGTSININNKPDYVKITCFLGFKRV